MPELTHQPSQTDGQPAEPTRPTDDGIELKFLSFVLSTLDQELQAKFTHYFEKFPELWLQAYEKLHLSSLKTLNRSDVMTALGSLDPRLNQAIAGPDGRKNLENGTRVYLCAVVLEAILSGSPLEALLFVLSADDLTSTMDRILLTQGIINPNFPLYSLDELRDHTNNFVSFLEENRDSLVKTGAPTEPYASSLWLDFSLGVLYPTKPDIVTQVLRARRKRFPGPKSRLSFELLGRVGHLRGCCKNEFTGCDCLDLEFMKAIDAVEIERIELNRKRLLDLTIKILRCLVCHLEQRDPTNLWTTCLDLLRDLQADEVDFFLSIDRKYVGGNYKESPVVNMAAWRNPGGLTALFEMINYFEEEIVLGRVASMREALRGIVVVTLSESKSYFDFVGKPELNVLNTTFDRLLIDGEAHAFQLERHQRVLDAIEKEFDVKIKRGYMLILEAIIRHAKDPILDGFPLISAQPASSHLVAKQNDGGQNNLITGTALTKRNGALVRVAITFDDKRKVVTMEGTAYEIDNYHGYHFFKVVAEANGAPVPRETINKVFSGKVGKNALRELKEKLPPELRSCLKSRIGRVGGYYFVAPPENR